MNESAAPAPTCANPTLLPCPFCGGQATYTPWCQGHAPEHHWPHQVTHNCPVVGRQINVRADPDTMEEVVKRWNARPGIPAAQKYAVKLTIRTELPIGAFIANTDRPYLVPAGKESHAHHVLSSTKGMVVIADKATLLANPFDLCEEDFNDPLPLPERPSDPTVLQLDAFVKAVSSMPGWDKADENTVKAAAEESVDTLVAAFGPAGRLPVVGDRVAVKARFGQIGEVTAIKDGRYGVMFKGILIPLWYPVDGLEIQPTR